MQKILIEICKIVKLFPMKLMYVFPCDIATKSHENNCRNVLSCEKRFKERDCNTLLNQISCIFENKDTIKLEK